MEPKGEWKIWAGELTSLETDGRYFPSKHKAHKELRSLQVERQGVIIFFNVNTVRIQASREDGCWRILIYSICGGWQELKGGRRLRNCEVLR